jgi:hypothetical protein
MPPVLIGARFFLFWSPAAAKPLTNSWGSLGSRRQVFLV